jgi:hypothetical protein
MSDVNASRPASRSVARCNVERTGVDIVVGVIDGDGRREVVA